MRSIVLLLAFSFLGGCGSANNNNNGVETCTQALCPMGGHTYRYCSAPHAASCRYIGSDGTIFTCVSCSDCVAAADEVSSWCATGQGPNNNNSNNNNPGVNDLAVKRIPDLSQPLFGCNGFNNCLTGCSQSNQNNPTGYNTCANDCAAQSTDTGVNLWVQAYFVCPATKFCGPGHVNDAGVQPCSSADLDPNSQTVSDACNECLDSTYQTMAMTVSTTCKSDITACLQDKP
jgi:hypothetical protein